MAKKSMIIKANKKPKYSARSVQRCSICGRPRGYIRFFGICRLCFRKLAYEGKIPGLRKSSW